jgi:predicted methyltransferase
MNTARLAKLTCFSVVILSLLNSHVVALDKNALAEALRAPERDLSDRLRDPARKPIEVLEFLGVDTGMSVLDVYAAGGYYTLILSKAVGLTGRVYAQNTPRGLRYEEDRSDVTQGEVLEMKIAANNLINVVRVDRPVTDMALPPGSLDVVLVSQIFHDYYNDNPRRAQAVLNEIMTALKPGGVLGMIDHVGVAEQNNRRLHRMQKADAIAAAERAGFVLEAESDLLANPNDNYRRSIFDPMLNRGTDQFLLRLKKPL